MKKLIYTGLLLLGATVSVMAQSRNTYQDDIYYTGSDARRDANESAKRQRDNNNNNSNNSNNQGSDNYDRPGDNNFYAGNNGNGGGGYSDYIDYDDDYNYSTYFNRFGNNSFYNRGYYSMFNNPYWYNPYWVDPFWGWSPWYRPGISIGFGAGPYWTSGWGWQSWYGYGGFGSYWHSPVYAGWGGWGWNYGMGGGFYNNYWNGYYGGLYGGGFYGGGYSGRGRNVTYGPRSSMGNVANYNSRSQFANPNNGGFDNRRSTLRQAPDNNFNSNSPRNNNPDRGQQMNGRRGDIRTNTNNRFDNGNREERPRGGSFYSGDNNQDRNSGNYNSGNRGNQVELGRQNRFQNNGGGLRQSTPPARMEQRNAPMSRPSFGNSSPGGGGGGGGSRGGGGGGGGFGGRR